LFETAATIGFAVVARRRITRKTLDGSRHFP